MPFYIFHFKPLSASFCPLVSGAVIINTRRRHHTFQFSVFTFQLKIVMVAKLWQPLLFSIIAIHRAVGADRDEGEYRIAKEF